MLPLKGQFIGYHIYDHLIIICGYNYFILLLFSFFLALIAAELKLTGLEQDLNCREILSWTAFLSFGLKIRMLYRMLWVFDLVCALDSFSSPSYFYDDCCYSD